MRGGIHTILAIVYLLSGALNLLPAQYQSIKFDHLRPADGLSQSTVRAICQDTFGFMWLGTYDGLNKYDGKKVVVYRKVEQDSFGLPSSSIVDLYEDQNQQLWISTRGGLCYLDREMDRFIQVYPDADKPEEAFVELAEDSEGNLWVSGENGALYQKRKTENTFTAFYNPHSQDYINEFIILESGLIWLSSSDNRLYEFDPATGQFGIVLEAQPQEIMSFFEDKKRSVIWLGTSEGGIRLYDQKDDQWDWITAAPEDPRGLPDSIIWDMLPGHGDELLIATNNGMAIVHLDDWYDQPQEMRVVQQNLGDPHSIGSNFVYRLYRGKDDIFWIGSTDAGISIWDRKKQRFNHIYRKIGDPNTLSNNVIWSFEEDETGNFWIGTSGGINYFDTKTGAIQYYVNHPADPNSLPHNRVWQILKDTDDHYWIGTTSGVTSMKLDPNGKPHFEIYYPTQEEAQNTNFGTVRQLARDHQGRLWVGTFWGLYIFNEQTKRFQGFHHNPQDTTSLSANSVRAIFEDSQQQLWIGTSNGLNRYNPETRSFTRFIHDPADTTSINDEVVRSIIEDQKGRLWIGTGKGLNLLLPSKTADQSDIYFRAFTAQDGLPNETIYAMELDDEGFIWISTNDGLSKFDPESYTFQNYYSHQGLQSHEFNSDASLKTRDGKLLFGGINGFNYFDPQAIATEADYNPVVFTDFRVNYQPVQPGSRHLDRHINIENEVQLDYLKDRMFYFEFTVLDLTNAATKNFAYRLWPFEEQWNDVGTVNNASYTNIPPGRYAFQVKYADKGGSWQEPISEIAVYIRPAYWQTTWFKLISFFLVLTLIYGIFRYRHRAIYRRQQQLETTIKERTAQINEQKQGLEQTLAELKDTQSKLIESEKMASLGQLTAGIAHEINNPIGFINGNAEALKLDFKDAQPIFEKLAELNAKPEYPQEVNNLIQLAKEADFDFLLGEMASLVDGIKRGSDRVGEIVRGLRIITYQSDDTFRPENLEELLESACVILGNKLKEKDIQLHKAFQSLPLVSCQAGKMNQVFVNIIDNAIEAMEQGGELNITTALENDWAIITITDNGTGMSEKTRQRLFEPFFTTKEVGKGTGLGLYISYGIVKQHNGAIEVQSEIGKGTTFKVRLPVKST